MSTISAESRPAAPRSPGFIVRIPTDDSLPRWRAWLVRHPIGGSMLAGAVATQFATVFGIWFPGFGLPSLNWPVANGELILGTVGTAPTAATYFVGELSHFADGVFFALLFALLFHPLVPLRNTMLGNLVKAFLYGTVLALHQRGLVGACRLRPAPRGLPVHEPRLEADVRHLPVALDLRLLPRHRLLPVSRRRRLASGGDGRLAAARGPSHGQVSTVRPAPAGPAVLAHTGEGRGGRVPSKPNPFGGRYVQYIRIYRVTEMRS